MPTAEIFISYSWNDDGLVVTEALDAFFQQKGITIVRDNRAIGYKGLIKAYMQRLGSGKYVVVVLSEAYFKSKSCMYELMQLAENQDVYDRIFPVTVAGTSIYEAEDLLKYVNYWDEKAENLETQIRKTKNIANLQGIQDDLNLYVEIRHNIAKLLDFLRNINTHPLKNADFEPLFKAIQAKIQQDAAASADTLPPSAASDSASSVSADAARLDQQMQELQQNWDLLSQKLSRLEREKILTTDVSVKFNLEHQIADLKAERDEIDRQLNDLQRKKKR